MFEFPECLEQMLDGESPFVRMTATSSEPGDSPDNALLPEDGPMTCWEPDNDDPSPALTVIILSEGDALVTNVVMTVRGVSLVGLEYMPSAYSPVNIRSRLLFVSDVDFCVFAYKTQCPYLHRNRQQKKFWL